MKHREWIFRPRGLRARFAVSLAASVLCCGVLFIVLHSVFVYGLTNHFEKPGILESRIQRQGLELQEYIDHNSISSDDLHELKKWEHKQPLILLELYQDNTCIYSSFYESPENAYPFDEERYGGKNTVKLRLADMDVTALLYSDFSYQYYVAGTALAVSISFILLILFFVRSNRNLISYICRLNKEIQILEGGNLEYSISIEGNDEISDLAESLDRMRESFQRQVESEQALQRDNQRLVTEMSHDLRTPLTGIMLYLEILKEHRYTSEEELEGYLRTIEEKARHLKNLSDRLFEYALHEVSDTRETPRKMKDVFKCVLDGFTGDLTEQGFTVRSEFAWKPCFVAADDESVQRIFENIASNIVKYAEEASEVIVDLVEAGKYVGFSVLNLKSICKQQTESNGVGIDSIRAVMKRMNGICTIEQTEAAFEITVLFPQFYK